MSDEENDDNEENYEIQKLQQEVESWKAKFKSMELKKREHEIALNKIKTEINSLRSVDKLWKEASKTVYLNINDMNSMFNAQMDQIMDGLAVVKAAGERVTSKVAYMKLIKKVIAQMQSKIVQQDETIMSLNSKIRVLTIELEDKTDKVTRLSQGIEEEVERLIKPMRDKLADTMVLLMKEKAARAQERRDLADLWPQGHLMPTLLMKYRALTDEERERRIKFTLQQNASRALSLEIRANVIESTMWEIKYDDYGRPFYEHKQTGETLPEAPEIVNYKPPPGRDEMGNVIATEESDSNNWLILNDYKGQVYFKHKNTHEVTYIPPFAYQHIPPAKTKDQLVCEAAKFVIEYIKEKMLKHMEIKKKRKEEMENPLTAEERKKKEKAEKNRSAEEIAALGPELTEEGEPFDLNMYQYDIETVEMLAWNADGEKRNEDKEMDVFREEQRSFLENNHVRKFKEDLFEDMTLKELDMTVVTIDDLRCMVEKLATKEEHLEQKLDRTRTNLRDFSFLLTERVKEQETQEFEAYKARRLEEEKERKQQLKQMRIERLQAIQERREQLVKEKEEHAQKLATQQEEAEQQRLDYQEEKRKEEHEKRKTVLVDDLQGEGYVQVVPPEDDGKQDTSQSHTEGHAEEKVTSIRSVLSKTSQLTDAKEDASLVSGVVKSKSSVQSETHHAVDQASLMQSLVVAQSTDQIEDPFLPYEEEELALLTEEGEIRDQLSQSETGVPFTDEELKKELYGDVSVVLFGDLKLDPENYYDVTESLAQLCSNLANFAMFCGFNDLNIQDYPRHSNAQYSLAADELVKKEKEKKGSGEEGDDSWTLLSSPSKPLSIQSANNKQEKATKGKAHEDSQDQSDDEWLSGHFFLTCSKEQLDYFTQLKTKIYETKIGFLPIGPLHPQQMSFVSREGDTVIRNLGHAYTPLTRSVKASYLHTSYVQWKNRQLMQEVIRHQLQQQAIQRMYQRRYAAWKQIYEEQQALVKQEEEKQADLPGGSKGVGLTKPKMDNSTGNWGEVSEEEKAGVDSAITSPLLAELYQLHHVTMISLQLSQLKITLEDFSPHLWDHQYAMVFTVHTWIHATTAVTPTAYQVDWQDERVSDDLPINHLQLYEMTIQVMDYHGSHPKEVLVGQGSIGLSHRVLGAFLDRIVPLDIPILSVHTPDKVVGHLTCDALASLYYQPAPSFSTDTTDTDHHHNPSFPKFPSPQEIGQTEELCIQQATVHTIRTACGEVQVVESFPHNQANKKEGNLRTMINDLRGDNWQLVDQLCGNYSLDTLTQNTSSQVFQQSLKNLPNFQHAKLFLEKKFHLTQQIIRECEETMIKQKVKLLDLMKTKNEQMERQCTEAKGKLKKFADQAEDLKREVQKQTKTVDDLKKPSNEPKQPVFPDFPPIPLIPDLPPSGGLDSRGKKKKALTAVDLKKLMEDIENGELDGIEVWPMPENFFPSQAQALKIRKAVELRNSVIVAKRDQEQSNRDRIFEMYQMDHDRWEAMEKKRLLDLEKSKKDSRKINIRYDASLQRVQRYEQEIAGLMMDMKSIQELKTFHEQAQEAFRLCLLKLQSEQTRQEEAIVQYKQQLLRALNARKFAYEYPKGANTPKEYEERVQAAEESLAIIAVEILECREQLRQEGIRWRYRIYEEEQAYRNECHRINISIEILSQRIAYDQIIARYKVEILQVYGELEKLKLQDADKDDEGLDTYEDLGERYLPTKSYDHNPRIIKCQRTIDLLLQKVAVTEGYGRSTALTQRYLIHTLIQQHYHLTNTNSLSWTFQVSDTERQIELQNALRGELLRSKQLLQQQLKEQQSPYGTLLQQHQVAVQSYPHCEMKYSGQYQLLKDYNFAILNQLRTVLDEHRTTSNEKINTLEENIINLSRECQKIREELLAQQMIFDEKTKVLWAFIHTLQTSLQQLSARLEIVMEEQERIVIESRLMADNTRHQVRMERKHSANLLFIIHTQRGYLDYLRALIVKLMHQNQHVLKVQKQEKLSLRKEVWDTVFTFTRLCTDVDMLFDFFTSRLANLAGARVEYNDVLGRHNAAIVLAALCKNPNPVIRRNAARALSNMGWNGYVEKRILMWDCMMYWKIMKQKVIAQEKETFSYTLEKFTDSHQYEAILLKPPHLKQKSSPKKKSAASGGAEKSVKATEANDDDNDEDDEFVPTGNVGLRTLIKQRKQWALRVSRRKEGPHIQNQKLLNVESGVLLNLLALCVPDDFGHVDWEISRNAALAISYASYEKSNHYAMIHHQVCLSMILQMCQSQDPEVQTHAAITIANLSFENEEAQLLFHHHHAIPTLTAMLRCPVSDILEAATAALANLTSYCDANCAEAFQCNAVELLVQVILSGSSENLLDADQNDEVHANAVEILANISRYVTQETIPYFTSSVLDGLIIMCASANAQLRRHVSLVLGNISQNEHCRDVLGMKGGVEALFLVLEDADQSIQANALWALCNLMWHPPNQERAGRFMGELVTKLVSTFEPVVINAHMLLGNVLYYNTNNRVRFLETDGALEILLDTIKNAQSDMRHVKVVEGSLRSMLSLSYLDAIALWLGMEGDCIPTFVDFLKPPYYSRECMRYSLEILCNLCLHHANRKILHDVQGIEWIVPLHADPDDHIRTLSVDVIAHLEDITPSEVLARMRQDVGLERMVTLASSQDPLVRAVAAESIGEEIWQNPVKQSHAHEIGAIDALLAILANPSEQVQSVLPSLWSLRNLIQNHSPAQAQFGYRNGISIVAQVIRLGLTGEYAEQTEKVFEACAACLLAAVQQEPRNSRKLVMVGLDALLNLTPESSYLQNNANVPFGTKDATKDWIRLGIKSESVQTLVKGLLLMLSPYNYVVCKNCHKKQDLHGQSCVSCGHRLLVDVEIPDDEKTSHLKISQSAPELPPWRPGGKAPVPAALASATTATATSEGPGRRAALINKVRSTPALEPLTTQQPHQILTTASVPSSPAAAGLTTGDINNESTSPQKRSYFSRTLPAKATTNAADQASAATTRVRPSSESKKNSL